MAWGFRAAALEKAALPVAQTLYWAVVGPARRAPGDDPPILHRSGVSTARIAFHLPGFVALAPRRLSERDVRDLEGRVLKLLEKPAGKAGVRFEAVPWPARADAGRAVAVAVEALVQEGAPRKDRPRAELVMVRLTVTDADGKVLAGREFYSGYDRSELEGRS